MNLFTNYQIIERFGNSDEILVRKLRKAGFIESQKSFHKFNN